MMVGMIATYHEWLPMFGSIKFDKSFSGIAIHPPSGFPMTVKEGKIVSLPLADGLWIERWTPTSVTLRLGSQRLVEWYADGSICIAAGETTDHDYRQQVYLVLSIWLRLRCRLEHGVIYVRDSKADYRPLPPSINLTVFPDVAEWYFD